MLVMERFGYPDFMLASADALIDGQYADRPNLRPIYDAIVEAATSLGDDVAIQARKTYVSLVSPKRTFARVQPTTRNRVDLALRLEGAEPRGRLRPSSIQETMPVQIGLTAPKDLDKAVFDLLRRAYEENR
jgi:predicted transport protein